MASNENEVFNEAEKLNEFGTNPKKYISKWEEQLSSTKEKTKESIKKVLPEPVKPVMEGQSGDIVLLVILLLIIGLFMKIAGLAFRMIFRFIFIVFIIAAAYIIFQKFF